MDFHFFQRVLSLEAYRTALKEPVAIIRAYGVTISLTVIGTITWIIYCSNDSICTSKKGF